MEYDYETRAKAAKYVSNKISELFYDIYKKMVLKYANKNNNNKKWERKEK